MTSEAVGDDVDPGVASPELVALVAKREAEMKAKASPPAKPAAEANGKAGGGEGTAKADQAEEVEAEGKESPETPEKGKSEEVKKALDVEWAKSDALKSRLSTLHEAGHLDDELLGLIRTGVERKAHLRAANEKFEKAAEMVKAANAERDQYRERAERWDRAMENPKYHAALHAIEEGNGAVEEPDWDLMTPAQKREQMRKEARAEIEAEKQAEAEAVAKQTARVREIEGWATTHRESLGDTVSDEEYETALKEMLTEMLEEDLDPRQSLTQRGLSRRVNRVLERKREDREVQGLREKVEGSKRDVVRSARASSPAGVRTEVEKQYANPRERRIAETLAKYPVRPD